MNKANPSSFYNTQHAPIGAFASFTLGSRGAKGGLGLELSKPADQNVFVGVEDEDGISCLPFFDVAEDEGARFDIEAEARQKKLRLRAFPDEKIRRCLTAGRDQWEAGNLTFTIHTPVLPSPEPGKAPEEELRMAYVPALAIEITVDNLGSSVARRIVFGFQGNDPYRGMRRMDDARGIAGIGCGDFLAIASDSKGVVSAQGFSVEEILSEKDSFNYGFGIGSVGVLIGTAAPKKRTTLRFVVCFYRGGRATTGMAAKYFYTRFFADIESVAAYSLENFSLLKGRGKAFDRRFARSGLNEHRKFMLAQAIHSYYGSTELLDVQGRPMWVVNEGEYRMMNTFDLTVDQLFFEMEMNPWTVRNELDWFVKRYAYVDTVRFPGDPREYPGGMSFTHDMGVANHFSNSGHSVYEKAGLHGCFSHMTHEELVNWVVCALVYERRAGDEAWLGKVLPVFRKALTGLLNRDHPDPLQRDGVMSLDSSRCAGGSEITTYDSLDVSLGQARNNLYLAVKCWGCYVGLAALFQHLGDNIRADICRDQARRVAKTIETASDKTGVLPAILHENVTSRIIPAVEGLIVPYVLGISSALSEQGEYGGLISSLKKHLQGVLKKGVCLFPDGALKISSTSDNSWLSKIYLCQFVAENILGCVSSGQMDIADRCHAGWLLDEQNSYWAWSDQMVGGVAKGSKFYPRGVTAILWLR